jgi:hypothetical protein
VTPPERALAPLRLQRPDTDRLPPVETTRRRRTVQGVALLALAASVAYLLWRVTSSMSGTSLWLAVPLLLLEVHALVGLVLFTHDLWDVDVRPAPAGDAGDLVDVAALRVAVLVPSYDEPRAVLLPTVAAAVATRHPHQTWVLDDGDRPWVREMAEELGARYRSRRDGAGAKAGNINEALPEVDADVVAVVDADHVVSAGFLEALLPYFADPRIAVVQSPQEFYNDSSFEHAARRDGRVYAEQELFYRGLLAGRNRWGAAFWCGTNAAVRVAALDSVGGVATDSVTEDIQTTLRMHRKGWRTVHHNEVLAYGLAADDPRAFFIQRSRWGAGAMQVLHRDNPLLGPRPQPAPAAVVRLDPVRLVRLLAHGRLRPAARADRADRRHADRRSLAGVPGGLPRRLPAPARGVDGALPRRGAPAARDVLRVREAACVVRRHHARVRLRAVALPGDPQGAEQRTAAQRPARAPRGADGRHGRGRRLLPAHHRRAHLDDLRRPVGRPRSGAVAGGERRLRPRGDRSHPAPGVRRQPPQRLALRHRHRGRAGRAPPGRGDPPGPPGRRLHRGRAPGRPRRLPRHGGLRARVHDRAPPAGRRSEGERTLVVPATTRAVWPGEVQGTWNVGVHFEITTAEAGELALALYRIPSPVAAAPTEGAGVLVPAPRAPARTELGQMQEG